MKGMALILLAFASAVTLTSCVAIKVQGDLELKQPEENLATENSGSTLADTQESSATVPFEWNGIRTNSMVETKTHYPHALLISSKAELDRYYEDNCDIYHMGRVDKVYSDTTIGFLDEADKYGEDFFEENCLILVVTENASGSIRHSVEEVAVTEQRTVITLKENSPEILTDDMANWHLFISIAKKDIQIGKIEIVIN